MAIYHQDIADIELNSGSILRTFLKRSIGLADAAANRFGVRVFRDGEPETLSGVTCQGFFKNADGVNIALTSYGTIDGNVAYVTLPAACYNVEGRFTLAIKLVGSDVTGTMRIVDGNVDNTNTGSAVAPTGSVPTYQEVLAVYEQMEDALEDYNETVETQNAKIDDLKSAVDDIGISSPVYRNEFYQMGTISSIGNSDSTSITRIRSGVYALTQISNGDGIIVDDLYQIRIGIYSSNNIVSTYFVAWLNDWANGYIPIPGDYVGKYAAVLIKKVNHEDDDISADVLTISDHVKYLSSEKYFSNEDTVIAGNNMLPLPAYRNVYKGVTIEINDGVISLSGTSTEIIRLKVSNGYEITKNAIARWNDERLTQFEIGKKYSLHNFVISGTLLSSVGVSLRNTTGGSAVSASIPEATLADAISYAMLYIPSGTAVNVKFIPMFINGGLSDPAYDRKLNPRIYTGYSAGYAMPDLSANFIYNSQYECAIKFPETYSTDGAPTPLIILAHGLSSTIDASTWGGTDMITLVNSFASDGFAVLDVNQVTTQDWCNPALIEKYVKAIKYATTLYNVIPVFVFGESMGSLIGLRLASLISTVKACVISGIRLDFAARYATATAAQKAIIDTNLGFTNGYDAYIASGWDVTAISAMSDSNQKICPINFPPTFFIYGTTDTLTKEESLAKIAEIKRGGTVAKTAEYTGDHNAVCYLKTGTSYTDAIAWFNQWM